jgi:hypothetical protein
MTAYRGSEFIAALILNLGTRMRWLGQFHCPATSPPRKEHTYPLNMKVDEPQGPPEVFGEENVGCTCRKYLEIIVLHSSVLL